MPRLTKAQIKNEILRCGRDAQYFISNYVLIRHPLKGRIPFKTYPYQNKLLTKFQNHRFNVILKSRQTGISTLCAAYCLWEMLFHRNREIAIIATKFRVAAKLVQKAKMNYKALPMFLKRLSGLVVDNASSFELENGSVFSAQATSSDAGRSDSLSLLIVDEAAFVDKMDEIWTAIYPTLSTGGKCIALSTPNGAGGWFYKTYSEAVEGKNDFTTTTIYWNEHPDRDQAWFEKETKAMTSREIAQELMCNFNMSGEGVFDPECLATYEKYTREPIYKTGFDRNYWIWEPIVQGENYYLSADVARGDGEDCSAFHIFKVSSMEIVAEYQGKIEPDLFAKLIQQAGSEYGNCMVVVENNSVGYFVLQKIIEDGYPNIYWSVKSTHDFIEQHLAEGKSGTVPGFTTSSKTRPLIIAKMEEYVRNNVLRINSVRLLNEMKTFVWNNSRPEAMRSYHDDLIMSCAIGCFVKDNVFETSQRDVEYKKALLAGIKKTGNTIATTVPGMVGHKMDKRDIQHQIAYYMGVYRG